MNIVFICYGNCCRSQIAEGLCKRYYPEIKCYSAGLVPQGFISPQAKLVLTMNQLNPKDFYSKGLKDICWEHVNYAIDMSDSCGVLNKITQLGFRGKYTTWVIPDPYINHNINVYDVEVILLKLLEKFIKEITHEMQ